MPKSLFCTWKFFISVQQCVPFQVIPEGNVLQQRCFQVPSITLSHSSSSITAAFVWTFVTKESPEHGCHICWPPEHACHIWRCISYITYSNISLQCPGIPGNYIFCNYSACEYDQIEVSNLSSLDIWAIVYSVKKKSLTSAWMLDGKTEFSFSVILLVGPLLGELGPDPGELLLTEDSEKQIKRTWISRWKGSHDLD